MKKHTPSILLLVAILLNFCYSCSTSSSTEQPPEPIFPDLNFDFTLQNLQTIADAKCETGFIEGKISGLSFWQEQLLNRLTGLVTPAELEKQSHSWHSSIMQHYREVHNQQTKLLEEILSDLVAVLDKEGVTHPSLEVFLVKPLGNQEVINAWVTGSNIYFSTDIITFLENDPHQIAGVMAHEIGHVINRHCGHISQVKALANEYLGIDWGKKAVDVYRKYLASPLGQSLEIEADLTALLLLNESKKYNPFAMIQPLNKFSEFQSKNMPALKKLLRSHPISAVRVNCVSGALARAQLRAKNNQQLTFKN